MDLAPEVFTSNTYDVIKDTYQKWPNDRITMYCVLRAAKNMISVVNSLMLSERKFFKY